MRSSFGLLRQYSGKASSTTWSRERHSLNTNGPVPTGWLRKSLPHFAAAAGLTTPFQTMARLFRNPADGSFILNTTWLSPDALYEATGPKVNSSYPSTGPVL